MSNDPLLIHIAQTQYHQGLMLQHIMGHIHELLKKDGGADIAPLAAVLAESKSKNDQLKAALDAANKP